MVVLESGLMFLKAINCEGEIKDKHFIADLLINTIQEIGPQKVVQVIADNVAPTKQQDTLWKQSFGISFGPRVWFILSILL